jgi:hypothetical protein
MDDHVKLDSLTDLVDLVDLKETFLVAYQVRFFNANVCGNLWKISQLFTVTWEISWKFTVTWEISWKFDMMESIPQGEFTVFFVGLLPI